MPKHQKISILHQDQDIIVVNKPPHVLTVPDRYNPDLLNLYNFLENRYEEIFIVHRLDKETSGIVVFARNEAAHRHLSNAFQNRTVSKTYLALIDGQPFEKEAIIDLPIAESMSRRGTMVVNKKNGKPSQTKYRVVEEYKHFSLVEIKLLTGRMHQIRVHFRFIGHPLMVDNVYNQRTEFFLSDVKKRYNLKKDEVERAILSRLSLHAYSLQITHPSTGETVAFTAELPKDMGVVVKLLRKYDNK